MGTNDHLSKNKNNQHQIIVGNSKTKSILKSKSLAIEASVKSEKTDCAVSKFNNFSNFDSDFSERDTNLVNTCIPENSEENYSNKNQSRPVSLKRNRPLVDMESLKM